MVKDSLIVIQRKKCRKLKDIQDGTFAKNFVEEYDKNKPLMTKLEKRTQNMKLKK